MAGGRPGPVAANSSPVLLQHWITALEFYCDPATFIADWWGDEVSPNLADVIARAATGASLVRRQWLSLPTRAPDLPPGQLRPLVAITPNPGDHLLDDPSNPPGDPRVRALALYAHQVAVWDPLPHELRVLRLAAREGWDPSTEPLRAALTQIATLQPLSAAGVVVWIPGNDEAFSTAWRALPEVIDGALDDLDVDGVPLVEDVPPPRYGHERNLYYSPWDDVHFAIAYVAADLVFCGDGGAIQPAFANQLARRIGHASLNSMVLALTKG